jgi:hypothetical protein
MRTPVTSMHCEGEGALVVAASSLIPIWMPLMVGGDAG